MYQDVKKWGNFEKKPQGGQGGQLYSRYELTEKNKGQNVGGFTKSVLGASISLPFLLSL